MLDIEASNAVVLAKPASGAWVVHPTLGESPPPSVNSTLVLDAARLILFGGYCLERAACLDELWLLSLTDDVWVCHESPGAPPGRSGHTAVLLENSMVVFGGMNGARFLNDTHELDLFGLTWQPLPLVSPPPPARRGHAAVTFQNSVYVYGGIGRHGPFADVWRLSRTRTAYRWNQVECGGRPPALYDHDMVVWDRALWVFGGIDGADNQTSGTVFCFSLHSHLWNTVVLIKNEIPLQPRSRHRCVLVGHHVILVGGCGLHGPNDYTDHMAAFDLEMQSWTRLPVSRAPLDSVSLDDLSLLSTAEDVDLSDLERSVSYHSLDQGNTRSYREPGIRRDHCAQPMPDASRPAIIVWGGRDEHGYDEHGHDKR